RGCGLVRVDVARLNRQVPPPRHDVACIHDHAQDELLQLRRIALHVEKPLHERDLDVDVVSDQMSDNPLAADDDLVQIDQVGPPQSSPLPPAEGQKTMRDLGGVLSGPFDVLDLVSYIPIEIMTI